jgi:RHS repeat-associated protein
MVLATLHNPSNMKNLPCGEPYIIQRTSDYSERFTFTGKERDSETGYGYFGARYMDHELMTMWLSVDPMADKYPSISPYAYCAWNPIIAKDPNGMDSVRTPNGMANVGTGYKATSDGKYLYGDGLKTKRWNPDLEIGGIVGDGLRGGYEDWDTPSDITAYVPCATSSETNSEFLMPPILPFTTSVYDAMGSKNFAENVAIRGDGTLMYANKEGFGKGLSWRNGKVFNNTSFGKIAYKTSSRIPALPIATGAVDVTLNARQYGIDSQQTYGAFGGAVGGILAPIGTGALIGGPLGVVVGLAVGIGATYVGEGLGKWTFDITH